MGRRLLVTGASGFVGRHVLAAARSRGWETLGLARSPEAARVVAEAGGRPVMGGLDAAVLRSAMDGADAVVHLAQISGERDGATYRAVNALGTRRVAAAAVDSGVRRLVLFSGLGVAHYGQRPRTTSPYFLSKLLAEAAVFESGREAVVFRPSYIVGPGDPLVSGLLRDLAAGTIEIPGEGAYRMQPIALADAAAAVLAALDATLRSPHEVVDLVGPKEVAYRRLVEEVTAVARSEGRPAEARIRRIPIAEADRQAASGGYRGMLAAELDCLLCDEVADAGPLVDRLGRPLTPLRAAITAAVQGAG